ncbi:hypothetical protein GCM10023191_032680 [Actinoallomurus oryzae]|uniref:NADPH-dependent FMN reductase n=1 Tax=Actinoallomurus oryzae TaxID=502180 RepID=A0ABP8PZA2_9ACTN
MIKIAVVLAGTRPGRHGQAVADWVVKHASQRDDARTTSALAGPRASATYGEARELSAGKRRARVVVARARAGVMVSRRGRGPCS